MSSKTHQTAVAIVPPQEVCGPIQAIRERHDRQVRRGSPHLNLLYPFYPTDQFDEAIPRLIATCVQTAPFAVMLAEFRIFQHSSRKATLWLAPEPKEELVRLQAPLQAVFPGCDDLSRFVAGFTPHLSVGQARSADEAEQLRDAWQRLWEPIRFELSSLAVLRRQRDTPFEVETLIELATSRA